MPGEFCTLLRLLVPPSPLTHGAGMSHRSPLPEWSPSPTLAASQTTKCSCAFAIHIWLLRCQYFTIKCFLKLISCSWLLFFTVLWGVLAWEKQLCSWPMLSCFRSHRDIKGRRAGQDVLTVHPHGPGGTRPPRTPQHTCRGFTCTARLRLSCNTPGHLHPAPHCAPTRDLWTNKTPLKVNRRRSD